MIKKVGHSEEFWAEAAACANCLREIIPTRSPDGVSKSPYERSTGQMPNMKHIKILLVAKPWFIFRKKNGRNLKTGLG